MLSPFTSPNYSQFRHINCDLPTLAERTDIVKLYLAQLTINPEVSAAMLPRLAAMTAGQVS